ncbi:MAG: FAD-dependent oxidoreductase [Cytophagaceae bacterium]|nr:FAD-dependent oxidoreductase [Cytophagaceae bacterium]
MSLKVIILGGGVAGLSAAHELIKRGFKVEVYELKNIPGGKARSTSIPSANSQNKKPLPGEHGFRFFPRFYKHITATMKEIPFGKNKTVYDNLVQTTEIRIARFGKESLLLPARFPGSLKEIKRFIELNKNIDLGLTTEEQEYFGERIWQLMTSSYERRKHEYERMGWWEFVEASRFSENYKTLLAKGLTRTLVAAHAETVSTKTGGDIMLQLLFDIAKPGMSSDRILNGPTNDVWINPWLDHLTSKGLKYHYNSKVVEILTEKPDRVSGVVIEQDGIKKTVHGDYYIGALPVEVMVTLLNEGMLEIDPTLEYMKSLALNVSWMNGVQFYLTENIGINHGHTVYVDTPWALTSICQAQFWKDFDWSQYGDGKIKTILSIDVSDWFCPGIIYGKNASDCTPDEIIKECWEQVKKSLNVTGQVILKDEYLHHWNIDDSIENVVPKVNKEPLLVNNKNTWSLRPYSYTDISNFFLAADYVKTNTDLATMEGANEAARRAVNDILFVSKYKGSYCRIWNLHEPWYLSILRYKDRRRYAKGLPWNGKLPMGIGTLTKILRKIASLF